MGLGIKIENLDNLYEVTHFQEKSLKLCTSNDVEAHSLMNLLFSFKGSVDEEILQKSWDDIVKKHSAFRTGYYMDGLSKPLQAVLKKASFSVDFIDWTSKNVSEVDSSLQTLMEEDKQTPFLLYSPPLMRLTIFYLKNNIFKMWWRFPQLLMDGWNIPIILTDFIDHYRSYYVDGRNPEIKEGFSFLEYVQFLKERDISEEKLFWKKQLKGVVVRNHFEKKGSESGKLIRINKNLSDQFYDLQESAKQHEITLNSIFQAAYFLALNNISKHNKLDMIIGATVADRPLDLIDSHMRVGIYLNNLPIKCSTSGGSTLLDLIKELQVVMMESFKYTSSSEKQIKEWIGVSQDATFFESIIIFENMPLQDGKFEGLDFELEDFDFESFPGYPLNLFVWPQENMNVKLFYDQTYFQHETAELIVDSIENTIKSLINNHDITVDDICGTLKM